MEILLILAVYLVATGIGTAILAASLFMVEDAENSSFRNGAALTWGKCAGIEVVMAGVSFLPVGNLLALVVLFVGVLILFRLSFGRGFLLLIINGVFSMGVVWLIGMVLSALLSGG